MIINDGSITLSVYKEGGASGGSSVIDKGGKCLVVVRLEALHMIQDGSRTVHIYSPHVSRTTTTTTTTTTTITTITTTGWLASMKQPWQGIYRW